MEKISFIRMRANAIRSILIAAILSICFSSISYADDAPLDEREGYTATQYPIVLVHGLIGFKSMFLGLVNYWGGIDRTLRNDGAEVFIAQTSALNDSEVRGELLIGQIETYLATTDHSKVNLIGHSQGALDVRYVATVRPDLIASITSVGGPNGAELGDTFNNSNAAFGGLITFTARFIHLFSGNSNPIDAEKGFYGFTAEGVAEFRNKYPIGLPTEACGEGAALENIDGNDIYVYSWGGTSVWTTYIDPSDALLSFIGSNYASDVEHDGIVTRCDSHLGDVIKDDYKLNHFDLVNQVIGLVPPFVERPSSIYRTHANRLKLQGL